MALRQDYQKKKFKNPYYSPKKKKSGSQKVRRIIIFLVLAAVFLLAIISRLDYFKIQNISISGNNFISESEIREMASLQSEKSRFIIFPQSNILFFSKSQLRRIISEKYYLNSLQIDKIFWHEIKIMLSEKPIKLIYSTNQKKYFIDDNGNIINEYGPGKSDRKEQDGDLEIVRPVSQATNLPIIYDKNNDVAEIGSQILSKDYVAFLLNIDQAIKDEADFKIKEYQLPELKGTDLIAITNQGWEIRFNSNDSYLSQVKLLFLVLKDKVKDRSGLEYIDLRFGDKIYYQ